MRQASLIISLLATTSVRMGVTTGLLARDVKLDVAFVSTEVVLPGNAGKKRVERKALRTRFVWRFVV